MKIIFIVNFFCIFIGLTGDCSPVKSVNSGNTANAAPNTAAAAAPTATLPPAAPKSDETFWQIKSGNFDVFWSRDNIAVQNQTGVEVFSARKFALERLQSAPNGGQNFENYTFQYKVLAVAGNVLFLQETTSHNPQNYISVAYSAIDLENPTAKVSLAKFFSEAEILAALNDNPQIAEDFRINKIDRPKTYKEFFIAYDRPPSEIAEREIDRCYFPKNVFESFYFDRFASDRVIVKLGVPCREAMREEKVLPLELSLPLKSLTTKNTNFDESPHPANEVFKPLNETAETIVAFNAKALKKLK